MIHLAITCPRTRCRKLLLPRRVRPFSGRFRCLLIGLTSSHEQGRAGDTSTSIPASNPVRSITWRGLNTERQRGSALTVCHGCSALVRPRHDHPRLTLASRSWACRGHTAPWCGERTRTVSQTSPCAFQGRPRDCQSACQTALQTTACQPLGTLQRTLTRRSD